jgi:hypothetical protein
MKPVQIEYTLDAAELEQPVEVLINVTYFHETPPNRRTWDSDVDYHGYYEITFNILHADGTPAPELDAIITKEEVQDIEQAVLNEMSEDA